MAKLTVSHEFHGMSDYWGGNGRRWDAGAACLFAFYGPDTTLRDCVDQWVSDVWMGGDFESNGDGPDAFANISKADIREAILTNLLNDQGRADYESGALCEFAADCEDERICVECAARIGEQHDDICEYRDDADTDGDCKVGPDDCDEDDCNESPQWIILVEIDVCEECGAGCDHHVDDLCKDCSKKHYPGHFDENGAFIS